MQPLAEKLLGRLATHEAVIGIVGLGYVGVPLAGAFAEAGFRVLGFDPDMERVERVNRGESYLKHIPDTTMVAIAERGEATTDFGRLGEADCVLVCVPTPLTRHREPDMSYIQSATASIAATLRRGQLVILESTTWPGTTREVVQPVLEAGGLRAGADFFLAYSPEREDPGNREFALGRIPKVVGGLTDDCLMVAEALYGNVAPTTVPVSSPDVAEATKLMENIFRAVNIAMVNELKLVFDRMGVDIWEVIEAAKSKPFGYMPFYPGPGMGGHCIPIDPFYLAWRARKFHTTARFIELAGEVNTAMADNVVRRLARALNDDGKALRGSRVLLLGVAYKPDIDDTRESPALRLLELLTYKGAIVEYHDPFVPALGDRRSVPLAGSALREYDAVFVVTDHHGVDYELVARHAPLVVDTRNVMAALEDVRARVVRA